MYRQRANSILNHIITNTHTSGGRRGIRGGGDITDIMEVTAAMVVEAMAAEAMVVEAMAAEVMVVEVMAVEAMAVAGAEDVEDLDRIGDQLWG
jgi:hypothetical protein